MWEEARIAKKREHPGIRKAGVFFHPFFHQRRKRSSMEGFFFRGI